MFPYHKYLQDHGITENDFKRMCAMSSWAICGQRPNYENEDNDDENNEDHAYNEPEDGEGNEKCVKCCFML